MQVVSDAVQKNIYESTRAAFEQMPTALTEITRDSFNGLMDVITVYSDDDIRVTFSNGYYHLRELRYSSRYLGKSSFYSARLAD